MMDVVLELLDRLLLILDDRLYQISDRHHADDPPGFDYGQMAHAALGHELHAVLDRLVGRDRDDGGAHDLRDGCFGRGAAVQDDFSGVVALRDDAAQLRALHDQQGPDMVLGHQAYGLENRVLGLDRIQSSTLPIDQVPHYGHGISPLGASSRLV